MPTNRQWEVARTVKGMRDDGRSQAEIKAYIQEEMGGASAARQFIELYNGEMKAALGNVKASIPRTLRGPAQGLTLGFADEMAAGVRSLGGTPYAEALEGERAGVASARQENPAAYWMGELGAAGVGGMGAAYLPAKVAQVVPGIASASAFAPGGLVKSTVQGALAGAEAGGIYGFGTGEGGFAPRMQSAAGGALAGGAAGGIAAPLGAAVGRGGSYVANRYGPLGGAGAVAERAIAHGLTKGEPAGAEGAALARAAGELEQGHQAGTPAMLADQLRTRPMLRAAAAKSTAGRETATKALVERDAEAINRIGDMARATLGVQRGYRETLESIEADFSRGSKVYDKVFEHDLDIGQDAVSFFGRPDVKDAYKAANRSMLNRGLPALPDRLPDKINMRAIQDMKEALDSMASVRARKGDMKGAGDAKRLSEELVAMADAQVPIYAQARGQWHSSAKMRDAAEMGTKLFKEDPSDVARFMKDASVADKRAFQAGVLRAINDAMETGNFGSDMVKRVWKNPRRKAQLRAAFDSDEKFQAFESLIKAEASARRTKDEVLGGSPTARIMEDVNNTGVDPVTFIETLLRLREKGGVSRAVETVKNFVQAPAGRREDVAQAVAEKLSIIDPQQQREMMSRMALGLRALPTQRATTSGALGGAAGGAAASRENQGPPPAGLFDIMY